MQERFYVETEPDDGPKVAIENEAVPRLTTLYMVTNLTAKKIHEQPGLWEVIAECKKHDKSRL